MASETRIICNSVVTDWIDCGGTFHTILHLKLCKYNGWNKLKRKWNGHFTLQ